MTLFEYINNNLERIKFDVRIGLITCTIIKHYYIYARYDYYLKIGNPVNKSVIFTAVDFRVSEIWVFNIIKRMEKEI